MGKIRVYELAKQLKVSSKDLVKKMNDSGIDVKNHMSSVEQADADKISKMYVQKSDASADSKKSHKSKIETSAVRGTATKDSVSKASKISKVNKESSDKSEQVKSDINKEVPNKILQSKRLTDKVSQDKKVMEKNLANRVMPNKVVSNKVASNRNSQNKVLANDGSANKNLAGKTLANKSLRNNLSQNRGLSDRNLTNRSDMSNRGLPNKNLPSDRTLQNRSSSNRNLSNNGSLSSSNRDRNYSNTNMQNKSVSNRSYSNRDYSNKDYSNRNYSDRDYSNRNTTDRDLSGKSFPNRSTDKSQSNRGSFDRRTQQNVRQGGLVANLGKLPVAKKGDNQANPSKDSRIARENHQKNRKKALESTIEKKEKKVQPKTKSVNSSASKKHSKKEKTSDRKNEKVQENVQNTSDIITVKIPKNIVLKDLAEKINQPIAELIKVLMLDGVMVNQNQVVDFEVASKLAGKFNVIVQEAEEIDLFADQIAQKSQDDDKNLVERPPVVVVMGHVDHGKTSLLDAIRHTNVINTEAGGITQHIGAYTVSISGKPITFLDTPGHEAFTAMRMRGAQATDIAVLVVAADDGIMPQTIEAINHAKAAGVEIVVAINKIDKPGANVDRVKQELVEYGLVSEDWGGQTVCVPVSAKNNIGIDNLLEMIILVAEMKELKANPNKKAIGIIIEAKLDKGRGPIATVLVQGGTLKVGDPLVAGGAYGKIRAMIDDKGERVKKALPSTPVEILGLSSVPNAGDAFYVAESEKHARQLAESVASKNKMAEGASKVSLDDLFSQINKGNVKELSVIIKADVQGSVEAIKTSLERLSNSEVKIRAIHGGVGAITESDIMLASASNAIIIGFNVRPETSAKSIADQEKVDIRLYRIIYDAIEDIKAAMKGLLDPVYQEKIIGHAQVRQLFKVSSLGTIAGSYVTDGKVTRNSKIRLIRDGKTVYEGEIGTLRRFKDDVKEVTEGFECGITISKFNDIKENDVFETYIMEQIQR